jgi:mono/diheme cytochrome c family protein
MIRIILTIAGLIVFAGVAAVVTARLGLWPVAATARASQLESASGQAMLRASLSRRAAGITNPLQPSSEVLIAGQKIFKMNCAGCHGTPGQPSQWGAQNFYPRVPQFADHPPALSAPQMFVAIKHGIRYSGMGAWNDMMSDEEIWKVATFLEHIGSLPPEVQASWSGTQ